MTLNFSKDKYEKQKIIAFCKSRKEVEVVLKQSRDKLKYDGVTNEDFSTLISGYRRPKGPLLKSRIESLIISKFQ